MSNCNNCSDNYCCGDCGPQNCLEQAINDALSTKEDQLQGYVDDAKQSADSAKASEDAAAESASDAKAYRDEAEIAASTATSAMGTVVGVANDLQDAADIVNTAVAGIAVSSWYYTTVSEGQTVIPVPPEKGTVNIQSIYIEGARQEPGRGFVFDKPSMTITLAEPLPLGLEIVIVMGTYNTDNPNDFAQTLASNNGASLVGTTAGKTVQQELDKNNSKVYVQADYKAKGDGIADDTLAIQTAAQYAVDNDKTLVFEEGVYKYDRIYVSSSSTRQAVTNWVAEGDVKLVSTKVTPDGPDYNADYAIRFSGVFVGQVNLTEDANRNAGVITLSDVTGIDPGDLLGLQSSKLIQTDHRGQAREGQLCKVISVNPTTKRVGLQNTLRYFAPAARNQSGTVVSAVSGAEFTVSGLALTRRNSNVRIRFNSGANAGEIRYVTKKSGNTLYIGGNQSGFPSVPAAGDSFTLEWMTVVSIIKPIKLKMSGNFTLSRALTTTASAGDVGFRGLDVIYSDNARIDGVTVDGFSETGIRLRGSFQPTLLNATVRDANRGYNTWDGTGYGISIDQCFGAFVDNAKTYRCRKGLDIIGTQMISWESQVNCVTSGGGVDYTGTAFWPNGVTENSGMGSHGSGYDSEYRNCLVVDCHLPYAMRGLRESYIDCRVHGYVANACLRVAHGGGLTVDGLTYDDTFTEIGQTVGESYSEDSRPGYRATGMVELFCGVSDGYLRTHPITIKNCNAKKVTLSFLLATGAGDTLTLENVSMGNNTIYVSSEDTSATEFSFVRTEGQKVIKNVQDLGGNRFILDGGTENQWCMYDLRVLTIPDGGYVRLGDNKFFCTLADDQALRIPISTKSKTAIVTLFDHEAQRNYRAHSRQLEVGVATDRSPLQATNKVGVNVTNTPLTGTTGTDGTFTVAFSPAGGYGYLYLENRMGAVMRPCVIIETVPF